MTDAAFEILHTDELARVGRIDRSRPLVTPSYFPAVSGASKGSRPLDLIRLITDSGYPRVLLSAYDVSRLAPKQKSWVTRELHRYRGDAGCVFLDCGVFESYWLRDSRWGFTKYAKVVREVESDFYAAFDGAVHLPSTGALAVGFSSDQVLRSISLSGTSRCVLIAHGISPKRLLNAVISISELAMKANANASRPPPVVVAIPERECGANVVERAGTIAAIRRSLDKRSAPALLHILGCGHPLSMAAYCSAGADTFDSIDWCSTAVDWRTFSMTDFGLLGTTGCPCRVCARFPADTLQKGLLHNLLYYQTFSVRLQSMIRDGTLKDFLLETLGSSASRSLSNIIRKAGHGGRG